MDWQVTRLLACAVCGLWALLGYGWALAGATRGQRAVRVTGRIVEVQAPAHGAPGTAGVPVVIAFPDTDTDTATGHEYTLRYEAERGIQLDTVWVGREVAVLHPPGNPQRFEVAYTLQDGLSGRGWPNFAVFLLYAGLVTDTAIRHGYPWALLGAGGPLTVAMLFVLRHDLGLARQESERLAEATCVQGRLIAVTKSIHDDNEGTWTSYASIIAFTTREGTTVTARLPTPPKDPATAYGQEMTVHYVPDAPEIFTLDVAASRRSAIRDIVFVIQGLLLGAVTTVAGAVLL
ncbi:DUF3592 domain-containing protein [Streptomyces sp. NBC_00335]|uniref:DUF3592 domain-containing protein n=1 Tax=unclassified Streptomyces TaxID=2593676 RepID=UPI0022544F4D|nr:MULTISPECIES: DUF3592 domain-containing protein [unclassified Streptomyces]MCX5410262.1 DUF3592 domain-containing protein [Streptomyces sp. NBC_00086]